MDRVMVIGRMRRGAVWALLAGLAACSAPPPPPPVEAPPPPPVVASAPPRPLPPDGAPPGLAVPPVDAAGLRHSPNRDITPAQVLWNLRSAYNVAALDCPQNLFAEITPAYAAFLKAHARALKAANRTVDAEFRAKYGTGFVAKREEYMTAVYNHFALPPTLPYVCSAVQAVSRDGATIAPADLQNFAERSLPNIEVVFDDFYRRYDQYTARLAEWNARWGAGATSQPGAQ